MEINNYNNAVVTGITVQYDEAMITFKDGRKLHFQAEGYDGNKLRAFKTEKVTKLVEETVEIELK